MASSLNTCPNCDAPDLRPVYSLDRIPVQSNLLMNSYADATTVPTGDLHLAYCDACGFIANTAFRFEDQTLDARYEATQAHSTTFSSFAKSLAGKWAERYGLRGKTVLEIGCGRGEFITMFAREFGVRGIGIDPIAHESQQAFPHGGEVRLIADFYSEKHTVLEADFICCRHTLEHIPQTGEFLKMVRAAIGTKTDTVVAFEVPDTLRVLDEGAFWDVYYEHCSYFTPGSLARLFRQCGFELLDLRREYDNQYLIIEARPAAGGEGIPFAAEESLASLTTLVDAFDGRCRESTMRWHALIDSTRRAGEKVVLWGSGSKAVGFLTTMRLGTDIVSCVVDINPNKQGTFLPGTGQEIVNPNVLKEIQPDLVIVMNPIYRKEIARDLEQMGVKAELVTL